MLANIDKPIYFICEDEKYEQYFFMLKEKSKNFLLFHNPTEFYNSINPESAKNINNAIFLIYDEIKQLPLRQLIELIKRYVGKARVIIFSTRNDEKYISHILKEGADSFLSLPKDEIFENADAYKIWFERVFGCLEL